MELKGKKVLILVEDDYEDLEGWYPKLRLIEAGAEVVVAGPEKKVYHGKNGGYPMEADRRVDEINWRDFDAVIIPGGYAPDRLRRYDSVLKVVKAMSDAGRVVAPICHGAWVPISAGVVKGKKMTCYYAIRDDLVNAGAVYEDKVVVVDGNMISSRRPSDLPEFLKAIISRLKGSF
ncbi:MAG: protease [Planctomycetes bacterium RIFCSPLOWO2_12_FULL_50_35]|uniref:type 1 glutamine amidotransferase domain-containing protein n=1 Tax=Candidatus Avalokitesvara rifleensis TaxID=3367620 RepID=UPI0008CC7782|nr:type 1 glutamine amidotransferase domain-containing protein [Candidatus Brocadiales bacterium]OHC04356.1 MAG: protease [Planctomycetes bacterium RIFCSPLOWO2_12_FULL_50_35]